MRVSLSFIAQRLRGLFVAGDAAPGMLLTGGACFLSAMIVLTIAPDPTDVTLLWPANALLLVAIVLGTDSHVAPRLAAGGVAGFLANFMTGASALSSVGYTAANLAEVVVGVSVMHLIGMRAMTFGSVGMLMRFVAIAGGLGPAVGATIGAFVATLSNGSDFSTVWLTWYASCALGALVVAPLGAICWKFGRHVFPRTVRQTGLSAFVALVVVGVTYITFNLSTFPLLFMPLAALVIVTVQYGWRGAAGSLVLIALVAAASTMSGHGVIATLSSDFMRALFLQFYLSVSFLTALTVAALLEQRQHLTRKLILAESRYRMLSEHSADALLHIDKRGYCLYASPASADILGISPDDIEGTHLLSFVHQDDHEAITVAHLAVLATPGLSEVCRYRAQHSDGRERWLETRTRGIFSESGVATGVVSIIRDVTDGVERETDLVATAATDALTGLANRRQFMAALDSTLAMPPRGGFAVAMLDIDHFKSVNDRYGHAAGDRVLQQVAEVATKASRSGDLVARLGGEEFAILLAGADAREAKIVGERVRSAVEGLSVLVAEGTRISVTLSVGVAMANGAQSADELLAAADLQLYAAKAAGRNRLRLAA